MLLRAKTFVKTTLAILFVFGVTLLATGCPIVVPIER
jgi:hypothetical protein